LNTLFELLQNADPVGYQTENQFYDRIFTLPGSGSNFFFGRYSQRLHALIVAALHDFDNGKVQQAFMPEQLP
jgi:hypothetical protein